MLQLADKWVWDFWMARDGADYHMVFLQADKALGDPELRHWNVSVGHARSRDLVNWELLPDAIRPTQGNDEAPDSFTTWTGCVVKQGEQWLMFYTGTMRAEKGLVQRVCLAQSPDLIHWTKVDNNPRVELDSRWYDGLKLAYWHDASWRDPWVFKDAERELYHMLVTCRVNRGDADGRGAIGYASSTNLRDWTVGEPFLAPGWFGEMEVPQIEAIGDKYYLFCSVSNRFHAQARLALPECEPQTGVFYFVADQPLGPWRTLGNGFIAGQSQLGLYACRLVQGPDGRWNLMGFINKDADGNFIGAISDPIPISQTTDGSLAVADRHRAD